MGLIINLGITKYSWNRETGRRYENQRNGLILTETGWKNFDITKHRRDTSKWGRNNMCNVCGNKCYQSFGGSWEQICLKCSPEWIKNSLEEIYKIKARLEEQMWNITENGTDMMEKENKQIDKWAKLDILDKLEND